MGFDSGQKLIASGVDVVILAEPPHFRPENLKAAIDAGKHVFCEKPVAVDAPGVRSMLATTEEAKKKKLNIVSGLCWRYDAGVHETMKRVLDGAIGEIISIQETYLAAPLCMRPRQPNWTEMDIPVAQLAVLRLALRRFQQRTARAQPRQGGLGVARRRRCGPGASAASNSAPNEVGDVYDHHAVTYEFDRGVHVHSYCRQIPGCPWDVNDIIFGTKGRASILGRRIDGEKKWRTRGPKPNMYEAEHKWFFAAIRSGETINNGDYMARSTMMAILGRLVDYTGQMIDLGRYDDVAAEACAREVRDGRHAAGRAGQGRQVSVRDARCDAIRMRQSISGRNSRESGLKPSGVSGCFGRGRGGTGDGRRFERRPAKDDAAQGDDRRPERGDAEGLEGGRV